MVVSFFRITGSSRISSPMKRPNSSGDISPNPLNRVISGLFPSFFTAFRFSSSERSEEHTSELQSLMRISYAVFCLKKKKSQFRTQCYHLHPNINYDYTLH